MKALFITTETNETPKYPESFSCINGNEVSHYIFQHRGDRRMGEFLSPPELDDDIYKTAVTYNPQVIVYLGSCGGNMPTHELFTKLNREVAPTVLMCSDAADEVSPWWPLLREYDKKRCFSVVVAIDGNRNWEFSERHLTLLTPIDPKRYPDPMKPHIERKIAFGFAGNKGSLKTMKNGKLAGRASLIVQMEQFGLKCRQRDDTYAPNADPNTSYQACADFMSECRITPNFCETGSYERTHVKGRVVEAGLAGCLLLEQVGSPACNWFEKDVDFLEFSTTKEAKILVDKMLKVTEATENFGKRLREKVLKDHHPEKFWGKVVERI